MTLEHHHGYFASAMLVSRGVTLYKVSVSPRSGVLRALGKLLSFIAETNPRKEALLTDVYSHLIRNPHLQYSNLMKGVAKRDQTKNTHESHGASDFWNM